jgi:tRNA(adenine34) deaminase
MEYDLDPAEIDFLREAIRLAKQAGANGNLPIGALIVIEGEIVARGMNAIWKPAPALTSHAEMEALRSVPPELWSRSREMTLYTTLEPCMMCGGAILLHEIGRLVFGAVDPYGGAGASLDCLPPYFGEEFARIQWVGPAFPEECDPLYERIMELEGRSGTDPFPVPDT